MRRSDNRSVLTVALATVALVVTACSTAAGSAPPPASSTTAPAASGATTRVEVTLTDALRIEPASMVVPAGVPVTFVVTNAGAADHEFYLGDEAAQQAHGEEMMGGGMVHDEPMGIGVDPGETKELVVTFEEPGALLAGCHVAGHYEAGMKSTVTVGEG